MNDLDFDTLRTIATSGPTPLFATVSGAHLYGFPSSDSDADLRGAFVLPVSEVRCRRNTSLPVLPQPRI